MLILSRVCVEFRSPDGVPIFEVTPNMIHTFQEAPDSIRQDPIFALLLADGSLEAAVPEKRRKELEQDPVQDADASGKRARSANEKENPKESVKEAAGESGRAPGRADGKEKNKVEKKEAAK